jgi:alkyldihydroxyacetonephosphate synthase
VLNDSSVDAVASLIERLPQGAVSTHPGELNAHSHDRWALAMLHEVRGDRVPPPAALVFPQSVEDLSATLAWAEETGTAIVPRGAATGLSGGAQALKRSVVVDLTRMNRVLSVDDVSQAIEAQAGTSGADVESALAARWLTLGHVPETLAHATVGGWIASASAGYASAGYGNIEDMVLGLTVVRAGGDVVRLRAVPRSAAGPDLRRLMVGSEGTLGIIAEATLAATRVPNGYLWETFRPHSFDSGTALVREIVQRGFRPLVVRLLDTAEASSTFSGFGIAEGPVLMVGLDEGAPAVEAVGFELRRLAKEMGARAMGAELAQFAWEHRHDGVAWYEDVMGPERSLGTGTMADTLDVAAVWRRVPRLYELVRGALLEHAETVRCRLSSPYGSGAGLTFSFVVRGSNDREAERAYRQAWQEAGGACLAAGGTISHHQGVGLLKVPFMEAELGPPGLAALRAIKGGLDPSNVLNPGKLIPS